MFLFLPLKTTAFLYSPRYVQEENMQLQGKGLLWSNLSGLPQTNSAQGKRPQVPAHLHYFQVRVQTVQGLEARRVGSTHTQILKRRQKPNARE